MPEAIEQRVSVITPISQAWARMSRVCFGPFDLAKWCVLGLALFISDLWSTFWQMIQHGMQLLPWEKLLIFPLDHQTTADYLKELGATYLPAGGISFLVLFVLYIITTFFAARGSFMFLDGLVHNRSEIKRPWKRYAEAGNALWRFKVFVTLVFWLINFGTLGLGLWVVWPDIVMEMPGPRSQWMLVVATTILTLNWLLYLKGMVITYDFIVPMMMHEVDRPLGPWRAWQLWLTRFLKGHLWSIVLFYLMRMLFVTAIGSIVMLGCCITCGLATLPYLSSVLFLPAFAFDRLYSAYYVQQFGPRWLIFPREDAEGLLCPGCRYDLRGNPNASNCPECGYDLNPGVAVPAP